MNAVLQPRRNGTVKGREAILTEVPAWHVGVLKIDGKADAVAAGVDRILEGKTI